MELNTTEINPDECLMCGEETTHFCLHHLPWCDTCRYRGDFLDWGQQHGYPSMSTGLYSIAEGEWFWYVVATVGHEEAVYQFLTLIDMTEEGLVA